MNKKIIVFLFFFISLTFLTPLIAAGEPPIPVSPGLEGGCDDLDRILRPTVPPMEGYDVIELQQRLQELGFFSGDITGKYDENTVKWIKIFQKENNIAPTGWVTKATWNALAKDIKIPASSSTPPPKGRIELFIDAEKKTLTVYVNGKKYKTYPVAVGTYKTPTPVGEWKIVSKGRSWGGGFGTRWMGLNVPWGVYGIHGTNKPWSIGRNASHGCIRMHNKNVEELFQWVPLGTPVKIVGAPREVSYKSLQLGSASPDVVLVQERLKELGFYWGPADGMFGTMTEIALKYFQAVNCMEVDGKVGKETYKALGLQ